jgi:hypothetical protein
MSSTGFADEITAVEINIDQAGIRKLQEEFRTYVPAVVHVDGQAILRPNRVISKLWPVPAVSLTSNVVGIDSERRWMSIVLLPLWRWRF